MKLRIGLGIMAFVADVITIMQFFFSGLFVHFWEVHWFIGIAAITVLLILSAWLLYYTNFPYKVFLAGVSVFIYLTLSAIVMLICSATMLYKKDVSWSDFEGFLLLFALFLAFALLSGYALKNDKELSSNQIEIKNESIKWTAHIYSVLGFLVALGVVHKYVFNLNEFNSDSFLRPVILVVFNFSIGHIFYRMPSDQQQSVQRQKRNIS